VLRRPILPPLWRACGAAGPRPVLLRPPLPCCPLDPGGGRPQGLQVQLRPPGEQLSGVGGQATAIAEPILKRRAATDVTTNPKVQQELKHFSLGHGVKQTAMSQGNMGCPHEEGEDYPHGEDCPFCPFWKGQQGSNRRD
jgi:hypothetical protein